MSNNYKGPPRLTVDLFPEIHKEIKVLIPWGVGRLLWLGMIKLTLRQIRKNGLGETLKLLENPAAEIRIGGQDGDT